VEPVARKLDLYKGLRRGRGRAAKQVVLQDGPGLRQRQHFLSGSAQKQDSLKGRSGRAQQGMVGLRFQPNVRLGLPRPAIEWKESKKENYRSKETSRKPKLSDPDA